MVIVTPILFTQMLLKRTVMTPIAPPRRYIKGIPFVILLMERFIVRTIPAVKSPVKLITTSEIQLPNIDAASPLAVTISAINIPLERDNPESLTNSFFIPLLYQKSIRHLSLC